MDRNEITRIAREAGFVGMDGDYGTLRRFANLVAAAEREACAKVCDDHINGTPEWNSAANNCAATIRARGNHANG